MKKRIIGIVFMFTLLFPFINVHADETYDQCMSARVEIINGQWIAFMPVGLVEPVAPKAPGGIASLNPQSPDYGSKTNQDYITKLNAYNTAKDAYDNARREAQKEQTAAVAAKLDQCNAIKNAAVAPVNSPSNPSNSPNPDPIISSVPNPIITPVIPTVVTSSDSAAVITLKNTVNSLLAQNSTLQKSNTSLSSQVSTLQNQVTSLQKENTEIRSQLVTSETNISACKGEPAETVKDKTAAPVSDSLVETPVVKKGFWNKLTGWLK